MDDKGKVACSAFLVSGASLLAAHMGFVVSTEPEMLGALLGGKLSGALAAAAKFDNPMSVSDFAVALVRDAKEKGAVHLENMRRDSAESGAGEVGSPPAPVNESAASALAARAKADAAAYLESKGRR